MSDNAKPAALHAMLSTIFTGDRPMGDDVESRASSVGGEERLTLHDVIKSSDAKRMDKKKPPIGRLFRIKPGDDLLSHGETPHYHRR